MTEPYRLIIWGAESEYATVADAIFSLVEKGQGEVLGIIAKSLPPTGTLDGFRILPKDALGTLDFDYLLVCMKSDPSQAISDISAEYGIPREKVIRSTAMHQPRFDFGRYMRLRESNVSIISNLCWGGFMYNRLDLPCMSPFRNLYIENDYYLRILGDLKGYLEKELSFSRFDADRLGSRHPVMMLGDAELHFNHEKTPEDAAEQWYARLDRVNWENIFAMMYTADRDVEHAFNELKGYEKRICFVPYESDEPYSLRLYRGSSKQHFDETVNSTARDWGGYAFDPIKLLLGEPDFVRFFPQENQR